MVGGQGGVTPAPPPAMEYTPPTPGSDLIRQKLSQLGKEELQDILNDDGAFDKEHSFRFNVKFMSALIFFL